MSTSWDGSSLLRELADATRSYDRPTAAELCERLVRRLRSESVPFPENQAVVVLGLLREQRFLGLLAGVADALIQTGQDSPAVWRHYVQALIDEGRLSAAERLLQDLSRQAASGSAEEAELAGLLGRVYKQMYVDAADPSTAWSAETMNRAVAAYEGVFAADPDDYRWHGINAVALLCRARRDGLDLTGHPPPEATAARVLARVEALDLDPAGSGASPWDFAVAVEAAVALGRYPEALRWLERYVLDPRSDVFELTSTLRQLTEVWQLAAGEYPGSYLLPLLQGQILAREQGGRLELAAADLRSATEDGFEKVLGRDGMVTHTWYKRGLERSRSVALISDVSGRPVGTGFLVRGEDLADHLAAEEQLLVTNDHVISTGSGGADTLLPEQAVVTFQTLAEEHGEDAAEFRVTELLWSAPPTVLDVAIGRLDRPVSGVDPCPLTATRPRLDGRQRVYVIGHPQGRSLSYSIEDNVLLDYDDRVLHYRAPTEHGSSGSPVFNRDWEVVAVHHAGRVDMPRLHGRAGTYPANEGIWVEALRRALGEDSAQA